VLLFRDLHSVIFQRVASNTTMKANRGKQNNYPLISIGVPTYNRGKRIVRTLASICGQRYPNLEVIVSDNCSTDNSQEIIQEICRSHPEIKYHRQERNIGMIANFEYVLRNSQGKYFMWVADDDALEKNVLFKYVDFLERNPGYSLASGTIKYWLNDKYDLDERGFTFEQKSSGLRVINFYYKVVYGGMIHGMMRRELAGDIELRKVIGNDYHFLANLAYLGEMKNFDFVGYHKNFGGTSKNFKQYARHIGDTEFAGNFPHLKMAYDAYAEVMRRSKIFSRLPLYRKFFLAVSSFAGILARFYGTIYPMMLAGRIKRFILKPTYYMDDPVITVRKLR
jgi:glycosyltransferase involved in cell wall biosynthesis